MLALPLFMIACGPNTDDTATLEPETWELPANPAESGVPVGVTTAFDGEQIYEVWYPASDNVVGETELADINQFVPESVTEVLGEVEFTPFDTQAIRDVAIRVSTEPYPVVVFSHGFAGFRIQSIDYAVHLASRGYVVVSADHPGRHLADFLPCVFDPALDGCDTSGAFGADPAVADVEELMRWLETSNESGILSGALDLDKIAISGHSAGGGTTAAVADEEWFDAGISMAAASAWGENTPGLVISGTCDGFVDQATVESTAATQESSQLVAIVGAGHMAFTDICELGIVEMANELLTPRDDMNETFLNMLMSLGSDGCDFGQPPADDDCSTEYTDLETSQEVIRHYTTVFLDDVLKNEGEGVLDDVFDIAELR